MTIDASRVCGQFLTNYASVVSHPLMQGVLAGCGTAMAAGGFLTHSAPNAALGALALAATTSLAAHRRLTQMNATEEASQNGRKILSDESVRDNLKQELLERYPILSAPPFAVVLERMIGNTMDAWIILGRPRDERYPELRGCVPESLIEAQVVKVVSHMRATPGAAASPLGARLLQDLAKDPGRRGKRWAAKAVDKAAVERLRRLYPVLDDATYVSLLANTARKVVAMWEIQGRPVLLERPGVARPLLDAFIVFEVGDLCRFLEEKSDNERASNLLMGLRASDVRRSRVATLFWAGAAASGLAALGIAGLSMRASYARLSAPAPATAVPENAQDAACRKNGSVDALLAERHFVPSVARENGKSPEAWLLRWFLPSNVAYFECSWAPGQDFDAGLRALDATLTSLGTEPLRIPVRWEGSEEASSWHVVPAKNVRQAVEHAILQKYPEFLIHRNLLEGRKKDPKRGVQGPDVPEVARPIPYEGFQYANLGNRVVRWPTASKKIAMEKELWDPKKNEWVKCLSR